MPESTASATELTSQYINQVASDLEHNVKEQERITAEITALQQQLAALQHDHTVLVSMQQALGVAATAPDAANAESTTVPFPRKKATARPRKQTKTAAAKQPAAKKQGAEGPADKKAVAKTAQPTLIELIRRHLTEQSEPRSAAEIATALSQAHPDRGIKTTVVRTSLENLVARNQAQRTKQGSSVFYTAPNPPEPTAAPEAEPQAETAG
ncbi:hypothetical protein [Streptomyces bicolor]|uniref:hypothetical protein n=1 Tax=Streptomyces bicolor TaxID=66874 RepID=UPI0004E2551C|nr:hypothetical protein [Streptomyces bicolor]